MILITRPKAQSKGLKLLLLSKGYKTFQESFYSIKYYNSKIFYNKNYYYIFPSIHAVQSLVKSKQIYKFKDARIFVIGKKVKEALLKSGCNNILVTVKDSDSLIKVLQTSKYCEAKFFYISSNIINKDFFAKIKKYKIYIKKRIIYKTIPAKSFTKTLLISLSLNKIAGVTFYSRLSVDTFLNLLVKYKMLSNVKTINMYCISKRVAKPLKQKNFKHIYIAEKPNQTALVSSIKKRHYNKIKYI